MAIKKITFLGLGMMGLPMAARLVGAGFNVRSYDPLSAARERFVRAGGNASESAADAAGGCDLLITMLPTGQMVRSALLGGDEPLAGFLRRGTIVLDMSSSAPMGTQQLSKELAELSIRLVDAPVSGGVSRARDGSLAIMAGGDSTAISEVRHVLAAMGKSIFETGPVGSGHAMKALNNYLSATSVTAACEALQIGTRFGLDPETMVDILNVSTGRNYATENKMKPFVIPGRYESGFSLGLMAKDLRIADDLARQLGVPAPLSAVCSALWQDAVDVLEQGADHTEIDRYLASEAAVRR